MPGHHDHGGHPVLQKEPQLWSQLQARLFSHEYDARDLPLSQKNPSG
jgi:hypothetical protein